MGNSSPRHSDTLPEAPDFESQVLPKVDVDAYAERQPITGQSFEASVPAHMEDIIEPEDADLVAKRRALRKKNKAFAATTPLPFRKGKFEPVLSQEAPQAPAVDDASLTRHGISFAPATSLTPVSDSDYFDRNRAEVYDTIPRIVTREITRIQTQLEKEGFHPSLSGLAGAKFRDKQTGAKTIFGLATESTAFPGGLQIFLEYHPSRSALPWRVMGTCGVEKFPIRNTDFSHGGLFIGLTSYVTQLKLRWSQRKSDT